MKAVAYCRVSTDTEEQMNSLENQKGFFLDYIESKPNLVYAGMYVDEGISGTSTEKRKGFNQMMKDADQGLFDLILIKDISRFARNIVDCLSNIRKLTALGIGVECISGNKMNTLKVDELTLTFQSFIAQQESVNTSERVKLGQRRQMEKGVAFGGDVLGYKKKKGVLSIDEKEADIVRLIFRKYCDEGKGIHVISKELEDEGIKTKKGNSKWTNGAVSRVLKNDSVIIGLSQKSL